MSRNLSTQDQIKMGEQTHHAVLPWCAHSPISVHASSLKKCHFHPRQSMQSHNLSFQNWTNKKGGAGTHSVCTHSPFVFDVQSSDSTHRNLVRRQEFNSSRQRVTPLTGTWTNKKRGGSVATQDCVAHFPPLCLGERGRANHAHTHTAAIIVRLV